MPGIFILSLDCEGKWGVADHVNDGHHKTLSDTYLRRAYYDILKTLDDFGVSGTFAITSMFALSPDELLALPIDQITEVLPYTKAAFKDIQNLNFDGWSAPWMRGLISSNHEIGCHGVTHTPWDAMSIAQARFELSLVSVDSRQTFIFPRNRINHLDLLTELGFKGFRLPPQKRSRLSSLAREFNVFAQAQENPTPTVLQAVPAGHFINWRSGLRRAVPPALTRLRARRILADAARNNGVAHFWTHPENIASAPSTLENLSAVIEEATALRDQGKIVCMTQAEYCDHIRFKNM